jgi:DNA-binding response OmpR family regulator
MRELQARVGRVVVLAHPVVGRRVEDILRRAGHEVHRTPDDGQLHHLVARLRPHLVIIALDFPRIDAAEVVHSIHQLIRRARTVPVLVLGEIAEDSRLDGIPQLPLAVDTHLLLGMVSTLLATEDPRPG